ncbi:MAG: ABC transporter ATP-binding protein [Proteobacteria bacterium]|nr:ABC transporter ATP-binding protein [Pseudomonadota bacterium]
MSNVIELKNIAKAFGPKQVLKNASLKIERGTTQVILGGSGTGKSVLLRCVLGLVPVDAGSIWVNGKDVTTLSEAARTEQMKLFGMLFQSGALFDSMTVWENVAFVLLQRRMNAREAKKIALEKLAMVGLRAEVAELNPAELSGGMRKRVALARAICHNPEIIFYDEPTTGLDPITADVINELIIKLQKELKCTSVVITHDMHSAFRVADRMAFLYQGAFIAEGGVKDFKNSENPYVRQFVEGRADGPIKVMV